ncbi:hypothetical protein ACS0TY_029854 [Phlomoides rotata]
MALAGARPFFCQIRAEKPAAAPEFQKVKVSEPSPPAQYKGKIVLQPRVCTLRSFGDDRGGVVKVSRENEVSRFFEILSDYVESCKKSQDFEIISGRLAMIVFAATVGMEIATGNSVFRKMDLQGIEEAGGVCLAAITSAAIFAWFSSNRNRVGQIFAGSCNSFIDSIIDQVIDGLFYDTQDIDA